MTERLSNNEIECIYDHIDMIKSSQAKTSEEDIVDSICWQFGVTAAQAKVAYEQWKRKGAA